MPELTHPDLPGRSIRVHDDAVPVHEASGWLRVEDDANDSPAEPVNDEQPDTDLLDLEKEN